MIFRSVLAGFALVSSVHAQPLERLAAIGDSLSDEYEEQNYGAYARNWVELLVDQRGVDFGPAAAGTWGEPRRTGYQDDWARYGADTTDAIANGQVAGVLDGAANRGVTHAVVFIGANNFGPGIDNTNTYNAIYNATWTAQQIADHIASSLDDIETIVAPLAAAGIRTVVANGFDFGATPTVKFLFPDPVKRDRVSAAITTFAEGIEEIARRHRLVLVDTLAAGRTVFGTNGAPRSTLLVGNVSIQLGQFGFSSGSTVAFVGDGVHPHTVIQGLVANLVITALDHHAGTCIGRFSEAELLAHNGLTYGGSDTLAAVLGPWSTYVRNFGPDRSVRFFGNGVAAPTLDRVTFPIDTPPSPADVGAGDLTLELWLRALPGSVSSTTACSTAGDSWINGNIVLDRDVFGAGDHGDYGLSLMQGGVVAFGVDNGTTGAGICGSTALDDGKWHHLAVTRRRNAGDGRPAGEIRLFVDGVEDATAVDGPDGDISYRDGRASGFPWDPFLVLGAEKHDAGAAFPSFAGWADELRISTALRYATNFTRPAAPFEADATTAGLWSFDEGAGTVVCDRSQAAAGPTDGEVRVGGNPAGPVFSLSTPFAPPLFADGFESGDTAAWSAAGP
jgi:hypothetical protein